MIISALKERKDNEKRVAIVPDVAKKLVNDGHQVLIEAGAGEQSFFSDKSYVESGAEILNLDDIISKTDILLVNTYGEVTKYLSLSHLAFLGGSLVNQGGQNPIEAAKLGCKICHGPHIQNFREVYQYLYNSDLSKVINNDDELYKFLKINFDSDFHEKENIIKKINEYGENILSNVIKEIKTIL